MRRKPRIDKLLIAAAAIVGSASSRGALAATTATWLNPVSGQWTEAGKWSTNPVYPRNAGGATFNAVIDAAGVSPYTVALSTEIALDSFALNASAATLSQSGGLLTTPSVSLAAGSYLLSGAGGIRDATIQQSGSGTFTATRGLLDRVTFAGDVTVGRVEVTNGLVLQNANVSSRRGPSHSLGDPGLTFVGTQSITGTGSITFDDSTDYAPLLASGGTLTIGPNITVQTGTFGGHIGGTPVGSNAESWINQGTIWARTAGQGMILQGDWDNDGVLKLSAGTLSLGGVFTPADVGTIQRTGGTLQIIGQVDATGSVFETSATTGTIEMVSVGALADPRITGGTVRASAANALIARAGAGLDGVTIEGDGVALSEGMARSVTIAAGAMLRVEGLGWIGFGSGPATETISGSGELRLAGGLRAYNTAATIGAGITVTGNGTLFGFANAGTIDGSISIDNGASLFFTNSGLIRVPANGLIQIKSPVTTAGLGNFEIGTGGRLIFTRELVNTGATLNLDGKVITVAGKLTGGTVVASNGGHVNATTGGSTNASYSGVYLDTDVYVQTGADLAMFNGTTMAPGRKIHMVGSGTKARFSASFAGEILFENPSTTGSESKIGDSFGTNEIGPDVVTRTAGGNMFIGGEGSTFTTNQRGLISAETPGYKVHVYGSGHTFNNSGELRLSAGQFIMAAKMVNTGVINISGGTFDLNGWPGSFGTVNLSGSSRLNIGGTFSTANLGTLNRTGSENVVAFNGIFNNTATTEDLRTYLGPWVFGTGATIKGGSIVPLVPGQPLPVANTSLVIDGATIDADLSLGGGANVTLTGAWRNNGVITNTSHLNLRLGGTIATADVGAIQIANSALFYTGTVNNAGSTLPVPSAAGNHVYLESARINGGTIGQSGSAIDIIGFPILTATTLTANATLNAGRTLSISNGLTLSGGARIEMLSPAPSPPPPPNGNPPPGASPILEFTGSGTQMFAGTGEVVFEGDGSNRATVRPASGATLDIGSGITIRTGTRGGTVGAAGRTVIHHGLISAQTAGQTITVAGTIHNQGTIEARDGGAIAAAATTTLTQSGGALVIGAGSVMNLAGPFTWSAGEVDGPGGLTAATANVAGNVARIGGGPTRINALSFAPGARVDLKSGKLVTRNAIGSATGGVYGGVQGLVQSARHGSAWNGPGITTSLADATSGLTALSVATAEQAGYVGGTFGGVSVSWGDVLVMYTYEGDANLDGLISGDDYASIDFNIAIQGADGWANGDFNYDGIISGDDYTTIDFNVIAQGAPFTTSIAPSGYVVAVPEPSSIALIIAGSVIAHRPRRRRQAQ